MIFVHTFWSKPLLENKFNDYDKLLPVILTDYAYSAACIHHHNHKIKLYADKKGIEMLNFIPYDEVIEVNLDNESVHFAAQIKFVALKQMTLDEVLIDGDLFMRKQAAYDRLNSFNVDFVYSMYEPNSFILSSDPHKQSYKTMRDVLKKHILDFKSPYDLDASIYDYQWPNTSLMLFHNQKLKDEYIRQYYYHKRVLENEEFNKNWPDVIIEQRHMYKLLKTGYTSKPMIEMFPTKASNDEAVRIGFTHLGAGKIYFNNIIDKWLKELDEEMYDKCHEQINLLYR